MKYIPRIIVPLFILGTFACSNESGAPVEPTPAASFNTVDARVLSANNTFGFNLFRTVFSGDENANVFVSPLSVSMALGMTVNGARGETRTAMLDALSMQGLTADEINTNYKAALDLLPTLDPGVEIAVANSIWNRYGFPVAPEFLAINDTYFNATAQELDFNSPDASDVMNNWVSDRTNGRIDAIVPDNIPSNVVMYLINTVYFKAPWTVTFDEDKTRSEAFHTFAGTSVATDQMQRRDSIPYYENATFAAADLRYGNGAFAMSVILPKEQGKAAMERVIESLDTEMWDEMTSSFHSVDVALVMPKFTLQYEQSLNDALRAMGMGIAFEEGRADLSGISTAARLFISEVKHKTFVEVTEQGTEAAAATAVETGATSVDPNLHILTLNRPFLYIIRERETGTVMFMGVYQNPE